MKSETCCVQRMLDHQDQYVQNQVIPVRPLHSAGKYKNKKIYLTVKLSLHTVAILIFVL